MTLNTPFIKLTYSIDNEKTISIWSISMRIQQLKILITISQKAILESFNFCGACKIYFVKTRPSDPEFCRPPHIKVQSVV